ncbi:UNVERIFIED_CONTAM: hypothetical protein Sradi_4015200 [Sesamum radiatum]|uniref:Reverse transcriptase domain-containing protein n=1 Tax=Sesamum radiatum TaxID=300843 RepID=A0AAW2PKQ9_SESRA
MTKAYDRTYWKFLYSVLLAMGFPPRFIYLIRNALENCWFTVLINGETAGFFKSTKGLRQGDPLSPAVFILAAEALSRVLDYVFKSNPSMSYHTNYRISVTHLSYADDAGSMLISHIEVDSSSSRVFLLLCLFICYKFVILLGIIQKLEQLFARYFWGTTEAQKKIHWTKWINVCYPTDEGGLGVRNHRDVVKVFSHKLWWRLRLNNSLWALYTMHKYCKRNSPSTAKVSKNDSAFGEGSVKNDAKLRKKVFTAHVIIAKIMNHIQTLSRGKCGELNTSKVKLNLDGASRGNPGVSGARGIIRDRFGQVILAYYKPLDFSTNMMVELQCLFRGLQLCLERGLFHVWIEVDAMHVVQLISKQSKGAWHLQTLLNRIRKHLSLLEGKLTHIFRKEIRMQIFLLNLVVQLML